METGFFRKYSKTLRGIYQAFDLTLIFIGCLIGNYIKFQSVYFNQPIMTATLASMFIVVSVFNFTNLYEPGRGKPLSTELFKLTGSVGACVLVLTLYAYLTKSGSSISREWAILSLCFSFVLLASTRILIRVLLQHFRRSGRNSRNAVIFGAGELGVEVAGRLEAENWTGINVTGFFDENYRALKVVAGKPVLGDLEQLVKLVENTSASQDDLQGNNIDQIWIALPLVAADKTKEVISRIKNTSVQIHFVPDLVSAGLLTYPLDEFAGIPILNLSLNKINSADAFLKNSFDKLFSAAVLLLVWPLMLVIALMIKYESRGPVFFKQRRYGIDGTEIHVWKFRSMTVMEDGEEVKQATREDDRVTRVGRFIRKYSLDELPQFINVIQGTMSVVGPRPHPVALNEYYRKRLPSYMSRHLAKPGISGLAQINGWRGETDVQFKMEKRLEFDLQYLKYWSIWSDLLIIIKTPFVIFLNRDVY